MRTFLERLDDELAQVQGGRAAGPAARLPVASRPHPRGLRRGAAAALLTCAGAACLALLGGSSSGLPALDAPHADASGIAGRPGVPPADQFDLERSRAFPTPGGPGYVVPSRNGEDLCVVLPDASVPGTYGTGCSKRRAAERGGLPAEILVAGNRRRAGESRLAFVLPRGASDRVRLTGRGAAAVPVRVYDGVAVATLRTAATLHYEVDGAPRAHAFEAPPRPDAGSRVDCGWKIVTLPAGAGDAERVDTQGFCRRQRHAGGQRGGRTSSRPTAPSATASVHR